MFRKADCGACPARPLCTRAAHQARHLKLQPRAEHEALGAARERLLRTLAHIQVGGVQPEILPSAL